MARSVRKSILVGLAVVGSALGAQPSAAQTKDERAIRSLSEQWQRDIADKNVDRIVALHTSDAVVMMSNTPSAKGSEAIRALYSDVVKTPGLKLHWVPTRIDVAS